MAAHRPFPILSYGTGRLAREERFLAPPSLSDQIARVHDIRDKIAAKEQEIADAREDDEPVAAAPGDTVEGEAEEVADTPPPAPEQPEPAATTESDETPA